MDQGYERRRYRRLPIELHLAISHMFRQDYEEIVGLDAEVNVFDISKSGIGFISRAELPLNYYFDAKIVLGEKDFFSTVVKVIRKNTEEDSEFVYGAEFVGLAPFLADKVDAYERKSKISDNGKQEAFKQYENIGIFLKVIAIKQQFENQKLYLTSPRLYKMHKKSVTFVIGKGITKIWCGYSG